MTSDAHPISDQQPLYSLYWRPSAEVEGRTPEWTGELIAKKAGNSGISTLETTGLEFAHSMPFTEMEANYGRPSNKKHLAMRPSRREKLHI